MRRAVVIGLCAALVGCASILGIDNRYYDGDAGTDGSVNDSGLPDASADGPLADAGACGACGVNVADCVVLACNQSSPTHVAASSSRVFWTRSDPFFPTYNGVFSTATPGGPVETNYATSTDSLGNMVAYENNIYVALGAGGLLLVPGNGGVGTAPVTSPVNAVAIDNADAGELGLGNTSDAGGIYRCGPAAQCKNGTLTPVYGPVPAFDAIAMDGTHVYWGAGFNNAEIYRCAWGSACTTPTMLAMPKTVGTLDVDDTHVYWTDFYGSGEAIFRADKTDGGNLLRITTPQSQSIHGIGSVVVDGADVFYTAVGGNGTGTVSRVGIDGLGQQDIVTGLSGPAGLSVDKNYVYFTEFGAHADSGASFPDGRVMRIPRPSF